MKIKSLRFLSVVVVFAGITILGDQTQIAWWQPSIVRADLAAYKANNGVTITQTGSQLRATWPMDKGKFGVLSLDLQPGVPLIESLSIAPTDRGKATPILSSVDPVTVLTVGTRNLSDPAG